jgi:hypothetical protein
MFPKPRVCQAGAFFVLAPAIQIPIHHISERIKVMSYPIRNTQKSIREIVAPSIPVTPWMEKVEVVAKKFVASLNEASLKNFNGRLDRGLELAKQGAVLPVAGYPRRFQVRSLDTPQIYDVDLDARTCTCPDSQKGNTCKHRVAAFYFEQANKSSTASPSPINFSPVRPTISTVMSATGQIPGKETTPQTGTMPPLEKVIPSPVLSRTDQILAELGFPPEPAKPHAPVAQLGTLYRRYLHGNNLEGREFIVIIHHVTKEKVTPHPSQPPVEKWCLWVDGIPSGKANGILFGTRGEEDLMAIFGQVDINSLQGKSIIIYPKAMTVAGQPKVSIRFRGVR